jgi:hypothetical protein
VWVTSSSAPYLRPGGPDQGAKHRAGAGAGAGRKERPSSQSHFFMKTKVRAAAIVIYRSVLTTVILKKR